jgi:AbrB family looped-hinge helix DNA binding protein
MMFLLPSESPDSSGDATAAVAVKVEHDGRILLPTDVRRTLGLQPGDTVLVDVTDEGMLLWTREMAGNALQGMIAGRVPGATSLVSELHLMRRKDSVFAEQRPHGHSPRSVHARLSRSFSMRRRCWHSPGMSPVRTGCGVRSRRPR